MSARIRCLPDCKFCNHVKTRSDEIESQIKKIEKSLKNPPVNLSHYNTLQDSQYVKACERAGKNTLLKKEKKEKLKILERKWQKYNKFEQLILQVIEVIYSIAFLRGFIHPVVFEDSWMFCLFRKI